MTEHNPEGRYDDDRPDPEDPVIEGPLGEEVQSHRPVEGDMLAGAEQEHAQSRDRVE